VGVTGSAWAAADTGTVAIYATATTPLWPSLLPGIHVVFVDRSHILGTLQEGLAQLPTVFAEATRPTQVKLISGPSMTADIEGELILGVHGPKYVLVLIYDNP